MTIPRAWTAVVARKLGFREHEIDDLHQEALLAAWKQPKHPHNAARYRLLDLRRGKPHTGGARREGTRGLQGFEIAVEATDIEYLSPGVSMRDVENPEVLQAVKTLEQRDREIAFRVAWLQETHAEIGKAIGLTKDGVKYRWQNVIVPALREALA